VSGEIRIYKHDARIHHRPSGEPAALMTFSSVSHSLKVLNRCLTAGFKIVAMGFEEGAMVAHLRGWGRA
jgi:hypothetical protein